MYDDDKKCYEKLTDLILGKNNARYSKIWSNLITVFSIIFIFRYLPVYNPSIGVPEFHYSLILGFGLLCYLCIVMLKIYLYLTTPRKLTFSFVLCLSYQERIRICELFLGRILSESLIMVVTWFVIGLGLDLFFFKDNLLNSIVLPTVLFGSNILFLVIAIKIMPVMKKMVSKKNVKTYENRERGFFLAKRASFIYLRIANVLVKKLSIRSLRTVVSHHTLYIMRQSKFPVFIFIVVYPIVTFFVLSIINKDASTRYWNGIVTIGGFGLLVRFINLRLMESKNSLIALNYYAVNLRDIIIGNSYFLAVLVLPYLFVLIFHSLHENVLVIFIKFFTYICSIIAIMLWSLNEMFSEKKLNDTIVVLNTFLLIYIFVGLMVDYTWGYLFPIVSILFFTWNLKKYANGKKSISS